MLLSIQYARGVAALLVVYAHCAGFEPFRALGLVEFGGMGVDLFFVISGFVMWQTGAKYSSGTFFLKRLERIVPAYWFYTLLLVAVAALAPALTPNVDWGAQQILCSLLFVPYFNHHGDMNPILLQGWTLNYEMYFYLVFAGALQLRTPRARAAVLLAVFLCAIAVGKVAPPSAAPLQLASSPILLEFLIGIAVAISFNAFKPGLANSTLLLAGGFAVLVLMDLPVDEAFRRVAAYGVSSGLLLLGLLGLEEWFRRYPIKVLRLIGDASYSLYLCHPFVLSTTAVVFKKLMPGTVGTWAGGALFVGLGLAVSVVVAYTSYLTVERQGGKVLKLFTSPASRGAVRTGTP